jgi:undecaprenyl diphosphate synthase
MDEAKTVPNHIGFILDGNRRWAKSRGLPATAGHVAGYKALNKVLAACDEFGVKYVSLYVFSTENWSRSEEEVSKLMAIAMQAFAKDLDKVIERKIRVRVLGRRDRLSQELRDAIDKVEAASKDFTRGTLAICFNYGGKQEIADAARKCVEDGLKPEEITEEALNARLYAPEVPPVDIVVRTSGEQRLSNFMLWRVAYSELHFVQKHWPDMTKEDVAAIIDEYNRRSRRFGK